MYINYTIFSRFCQIWMIKFIISVKVTPDIFIKIADIHRKGPKGIRLSLLLNRTYIAMGNAMNVARKIVNTAIGYPKTRPKRNINFISPPPSDSFLKSESPTNLTAYIVRNAKQP